MAPTVRFPEAPTTERPAPKPDTSSLPSAQRSGRPANRTLVDCYAWLTRVGRGCRNQATGERHEIVRDARRRLLHGGVDCSWAHRPDLVHYAVAYLDDLATGGALPGDRALAGYHPKIRNIHARLPKYADAIWPVLLVGERGTGKGHLLRAITRLCDTVPLYVPLATMTEGMAASELFGHTKGAFTGADRARDGLILTAHNARSAIFLDDVGECPPNIQAKLLTVLDDGVLRAVGSDRMVSVGRKSRRVFRIYASSQPASLAKLRPDFHDRLMTLRVIISPLRERGMDVLLLADRFLREAGAATKKEVKALSGEAQWFLLEYDWPGNVRELRNLMLRAAFEFEGRPVLDAASVKACVDAEPVVQTGQGDTPRDLDSTATRFPTLAEMTDTHIRAALDRARGNVSAAAALLGRHRSTVHKWLRGQGKEEAGDGKEDSG